MRKTKIVQVLRCFSLAAMVLSGSMTVAAAGWQDGVVIKGEKGSEATDVRIGQERYGPISSNDTLWDIARRYKPHSSVTQYQTMVAIVQANDDAFVDGNMNRMLDGFYLRIPSLQEIKMVNPEAARRQVVVDGQLKAKSQQLSQAQQDTQKTRAEQQELLEQARAKAEQTIQEVEQRQEQNFEQLRADMRQSMQAVERMYGENKSLQERIDALAARLDELANNVSKTDELEVQFQQVLAQQRELLEQQAREEIEEESGFSDWLQSPLNMLLVSVLPALLIIGLIVFLFLRRSTKPADDEEEPEEKSSKELTEEEAAAELDKELLGDVPNDSTDGLFDIDGEEGTDDEGDDLSALEAELTGNSDEAETADLSVRLDDGKDDGKADVKTEETQPEAEPAAEDDLDDDDQAVLPDEEDEESSELSQDELDRLFGEADDDDEQAIDLSVNDDEEQPPESSGSDADEPDSDDTQQESDTTEEESAVADSDDIDDILSDNAPSETPEETERDDEPAADETADEGESESDEENDDLLPDDFDDSEVDDVLAELGLTESETGETESSEAESAEEESLESEREAEADEAQAETTPEQEDTELTSQEEGQSAEEDSEEDELEQLLQESDELTQSLDDLDDLEEEVPDDDAELDQAEDEADKDLESLFGGADNTDNVVGEEELATEEDDTETEAETDTDGFSATDDDEFVDIDSLMADADEEDEDSDRYQSSAVKDVLPDDESGDAEGAPQDDDPAGQLDLARAYIEMGEEDEAREILQQLAEGDDEALANEARTLQQKLDS